MTGWHRKSLGDAMFADEALDRLEEAFRSGADGARPPPRDAAVFVRHESEGRLQCEVVAYFSPAAADLALAEDAEPCPRPARAGLDLLAGSGEAGEALFPGEEG